MIFGVNSLRLEGLQIYYMDDYKSKCTLIVGVLFLILRVSCRSYTDQIGIKLVTLVYLKSIFSYVTLPYRSPVTSSVTTLQLYQFALNDLSKNLFDVLSRLFKTQMV